MKKACITKPNLNEINIKKFVLYTHSKECRQSARVRTLACNMLYRPALIQGNTMFETLTDKLGSVFSKITSRGVLNESDIDQAMREIRIALLEADVSLSVVKILLPKLKSKL